MSSKTPAQVLEALRRLQSSSELSIIKLSEPISNSTPGDARQRISDASNTSLDGPSPTSLDADLVHYKELFAKLRFSYVEQVTKEKFIRAIVGDPPLIVTLQENLDLERENVEAKAQLKNLKLEVAEMVSDLEKMGRELSKRYEKIQLETVRLEELPAKITELENRIEELKDQHESSESDPNLRLPLTKTLGLVSKRKAEQQELARELEALQSKVPRKRKEAERLQAELQPLEVKRQSSTTAAREARRRKEAALGGVADDLEQRARWWRASESMLKQVLDIKP
ncbi:60s ribosomal l37 [Trichoderma arundinaceum]|uniref:60s ribosomal l37 n=1 Tax=Trichoderma arundinaceum TaxID=490622 RepID=A0A395NLF7_TRIAR|nr:60s ribosomal l37 [Trichoderma arundinaceum]